MIKIIKNTMTEPTEITCQFCNSVLAYTYLDINREEKPNELFPMLKGYTMRYLVCPVCKCDIDLNPAPRLTGTTKSKGDKK